MRETKERYVSERITNIKELESYIEKSHLSILSLINGIEKGKITSIHEINDMLVKIDSQLEKAYTFEFCLERRITVDRKN